MLIATDRVAEPTVEDTAWAWFNRAGWVQRVRFMNKYVVSCLRAVPLLVGFKHHNQRGTTNSGGFPMFLTIETLLIYIYIYIPQLAACLDT